MNGQLREIIAHQYPLDILEIENYQHLWKIKTKEAVYLLKAYDKNSHHIEWIHFFNHQLAKKGFCRFPNFLETRDKKPSFPWQGAVYVLMPMLTGRNARYSNLEDIDHVITILANFHHHASFLEKTIQPPVRKIIYQKYEDRLNRFIKLYKQLPYKQNRSILDKYILLLGKEMIKYGISALQRLDIEAIHRLQQQTMDYAIVSHRDVASHNFLIEKGKGSMIDFDLTGYEPQGIDLLQLTQRIMVEWSWDINLFFQIENKYNSLHSLQEAEKQLIYQLSRFPNEFFREVLGVYERPQKFKSDYVLRLLEKYVNQYQRFQQFQKEMNKL